MALEQGVRWRAVDVSAIVVTLLLMLVGVPVVGALFAVALAAAVRLLLKDRREAVPVEE
jgi:hypothetical protein